MAAERRLQAVIDALRAEQATSVIDLGCGSGRLLSRLLQLGILAAIIALWQIGVEVGLIDGFFWSYPSQIWAKFLLS